MKAVLLPGDRRVDVVDREVPTAGLGQVVVQVRAAGLCGSDIHMLYRTPAAQRKGSIMAGLEIDPDIVAGHEPAGVITEVGQGVAHLAVGDRVAVAHISGCGHCIACRRGWDIDCENKTTYGFDRDGAMSEFMVAEAKDCATLPDTVSFEEGAFYACGAGTGFWALRRGGFGPGETVVVVGLGPVGVCAAFFAAQAGARVIGIDPVQQRRDYARAHGAHVVIDPMTGDVADAVRRANGGRGADLALDASGSSAGRVSALDAIRTRGRVVYVGFGDSATTIDVGAKIIEKQATVIGSWVYSTPELQEMILEVADRGISIEPLISQRYGIDDIERGWAEFDAGSLGKSMLVWS